MAITSLPRDPSQDVRTRRFTQQLQTIINSLLQSGDIVQTGKDQFSIGPSASLVMFTRLVTPKTFSGYGMWGG